MSGLPETVEAKNILSAEAYHKDSDFFIVSKTTETNLKENHAQYSHYDAYMSERGIVYIMKDFNETYTERLQTECIMLFIMELIVLKITAINMANDAINKAYAKEEVLTKDILEILENFAKSLPLWETQHFRYFLAQEFANRVESSFKVSRYLADYERSRKQLEQIVNIRKINTSEKETRVVTFFATILAIGQIIPITRAIEINKSDSWGNILKQNTAPIITLIIIVVFTTWFFFGKKLKNKITQKLKEYNQRNGT
jgi:ribosomal protein L18E